MGLGSSSAFDETCKKQGKNKKVCTFEGKGDKKATVVMQGGPDGQVEPVETNFENMTEKDKKKVLKTAQSRVTVSNSNSPLNKRTE